MEEQANKANKRNSKVSALQLELWNKGFFKGIKDRHGKEATFNTAVDGISGKMTKQAIENAKKAGYNIDSKLGLQKYSGNTQVASNSKINNKQSNLGQIFQMTRATKTGGFNNSNPYSKITNDSKNTGEQAILDHIKRFNIKGRKGIINKKDKTFKIYHGDSLVAQYPITDGQNIGDGMFPLDIQYLSQAPKTTGAGVFTVEALETSPYMGHEPMFRLMPDSVGHLVQAIHSPAGPSRIQAVKNKTGSTTGCLNGLCGMTSEIFNKKLLQSKDSVYILPEIEGNELIEKNGRLQMSWGNNNPETYVDTKGKTHKFRYNNKI